MNIAIIIGNLVKDPEMRSTQNGSSVCNFTVAVNRQYKDANGETQTDFIDVVCWRQLADLCGKHLMKGKKVAVKGEFVSRQYTDKNGIKRTAWSLNAESVQFLSPKDNNAMPKSNAANNQSFTEVYDEDMPF